MNSISKSTARKETKISFRTSEEIFSRLKAISRIENTSVSSFVENILSNFLIRCNVSISPRLCKDLQKKCSFPTFVSFSKNGKNIYIYGTVIDFVQDEVKIILVNPSNSIVPDGNFFSLFKIVDEILPSIIKCELLSIEYIHNECILIGKFESNVISKKIDIHR